MKNKWINFVKNEITKCATIIHSELFITNLVTIIIFIITLNQSDRLNQEQFKQSIMPYINIEVDAANINYEESHYYLDTNTMDLRVMLLTQSLVEYCNNLVFPFLESEDEECIHNEAIYPYIQSEFVDNKSVGTQLKQVTLQNIGLNSAVSVNIFINNICQWKFNLVNGDKYVFFLIISPEMFGKRTDIKVVYQDIIGNQYEQECYFIITPYTDFTGEYYEISMVSNPQYVGKEKR